MDSVRQIPLTMWLMTAVSLGITVLVAALLHRLLRPANGLSHQAPASPPELRQIIREILVASRAPVVSAIGVVGVYLSVQPLLRTLETQTGLTLLVPLEKLRDGLLFLWTFWVLYRIARRLAHYAERWGQRQDSTLESLFIPVLANGLQLILPLIALLLARPLLPTAPRYTAVVKLVVSMLLIITVAWVLIRALNVMDRLVAIRYPIHVADNLQARSIRTQFSFLRKLGIFLVMLIAGASILMLFDGARQLGTSLLTSAGILGLVVGFAAQKILGNLLAGFQIALTQPIRIDDAVIVENEWGWIEELTLTYVVVRLWDWRRLVLPINYFIEKPFQNWTRNSAELIGSVFLYTDYAVPLEPLRAELTRLLAAHPLWDGKVNVLQVTDSRERVIELRALMSARNAPEAWDLRCAIREGLITYLQREHPEALPRLRAEISGEPLRPQKADAPPSVGAPPP
ncbi:MAG TPA: mechanosensitive ion channel domain-containing protein [Candidatus Acidoferrales bacterium]|nr:mechanosensitive ion channel domain-containing protein [Candidatus Acidoferrales bacterium]